jgi:hypothetical protein
MSSGKFVNFVRKCLVVIIEACQFPSLQSCLFNTVKKFFVVENRQLIKRLNAEIKASIFSGRLFSDFGRTSDADMKVVILCLF